MLLSFVLKSKSFQIRHYAKMSSKCLVAVCQFTATNNKENNWVVVKDLVERSVKKSAKVVFLPEACDYISETSDELKLLSEPLNGELINRYKNLAKDHNVWLSLGGFHEKSDVSIVHNSHILIDSEGQIKQIYRKAHLFDVTIPEKNVNLRESENITGGSQILEPVETPAGSLALAVCYDLRFPELSTLQRKLGSEILTFPSAFTNITGKAHWEVLLRARAIENQCYVIAAAQYGRHNKKRVSYGHSMIVDPWGNIIAECPKYDESKDTDESIALAEIDLDLIKRVRSEIPVFSHRRNDIYTLNLNKSIQKIGLDNYSFADKTIPADTIFYRSQYCFAFTNIRCVVPGHVLIASLRVARRMQDLNQEEIADLFQTAVRVSKTVEQMHNAQSSTVCVQDGQFAGQTVPHVHVHILPRKQGDFENNDDIYMHLAQHDKDNNTDRLRTVDEQKEEASLLRKYFYQY